MAKLEAGTAAPAFTLPDQDGKPVKLSDFKGQRKSSSTSTRPTTRPAARKSVQFNDNLGPSRRRGWRYSASPPTRRRST